ncbi:MAG: hypothetical protein ETSY1_35835 [Candidatus Entotheonella factor]|uniref:POTRA domain-containing protein n=1 Tax=Entotheonella factor TaxID=1429438 RepID=W4L859_ENTF1|nr:MAG: hypothetical protein ETSY1_35835 [Candidatus Entotheonella factor]
MAHAQVEVKSLPQDRLFVRDIRVTGSTVFSSEELEEVIVPYRNRELSAEDLEELRLALTQLYVKRGFVNSGSILPNQNIVNETITFHVIEGHLSRIDVEGNRWYRTDYLRKRLRFGLKIPLDIEFLRQQLQLLKQDPRIERLNAQLRPGDKLGEGVLHLQLEESLPFDVFLGLNNYQSPTLGLMQGLVIAEHQNVLGRGDTLGVTFKKSEGSDLQIDTQYSLPLSARDDKLIFRYRKDDTTVVQGPFRALDIESRSDVFEVTLRYPLYRTLTNQLVLGVTAGHIRSRTFLQDIPVSFSLGVENGKSIITPLRFTAQWLKRTMHQVIAIQSRLTWGIDAFGATTNANGLIPDGKFLAWLAQLQWVQRLEFQNMETIFRLDVQLTTEPLLSVEQMASGGRFSVRGYQENQFVRDNGLITSLEVRIPVWQNRSWADFVQLSPFIDFSKLWNADRLAPNADSVVLISTGIGLRWALTSPFRIPIQPQLEVFWGYRLKEVDMTGDRLQGNGVHLQFLAKVL